MIITTHAVVGATVTNFLKFNPPLALGAALASHFLLDAIPHYDYQLVSLTKNKISRSFKLDHHLWLKDIKKLGLDILLTFTLVYFFWPPSTSGYLVYLGIGLAILPDGLHFLSYLINSWLTNIITRFHQFTHTSWRLVNPIWGLFWQSLIILIALIISR
jgi:hypothetical protein